MNSQSGHSSKSTESVWFTINSTLLIKSEMKKYFVKFHVLPGVQTHMRIISLPLYQRQRWN